jgi:PadR family transcriptional regulator, regulatory protein PadR
VPPPDRLPEGTPPGSIGSVTGDTVSDRELLEQCACEGGQPKNFLRPCLLLLLKEDATHGYELIERLRPFGFEKSDPGGVYRTLRALEGEGLVRSSWETSSAGPARRRYRLTRRGEDMLHAWAVTLAETGRVLDQYLDRYSRAAATTARLPASAR